MNTRKILNLSVYIFFVLIFLCFKSGLAQNEAKYWCFGNYQGLDFTSTPPATVTNSYIDPGAHNQASCISDASGNLLFYTDGQTVWNQSHGIMANGQFLNGTTSGGQSSLIVKQPGSSNVYYIFTVGTGTGVSGFYYSLVDISLAAGVGSVTVKNATLSTNPMKSFISGTRHCNGTDVWIVVGEVSTTTTTLSSYLLTSGGINSPVTSSFPLSFSAHNNTIKISPNGKKIGLVNYGSTSAWLFDFDNNSGVISNILSLVLPIQTYEGCEFSPDGTKFYAGCHGGSPLLQWNLCAGNATTIASSIYSLSASVSSLTSNSFIQLAPDGKIYTCIHSSGNLGNRMSVINNPNIPGSGCNFGVGPLFPAGAGVHSIPNFMGSYFLEPPTSPPFTVSANTTAGCKTVSFTAPPQPSVYCAAAGYSIDAILWNFGEPSSGSANTSTLTNPTHTYATAGTYTAQLILYYSCGGGTDTLKKVLNIVQPTLSVSNSPLTCTALGSATISIGAGTGTYTCAWQPSLLTGTAVSGLTTGSYTVSVFDVGAGCTTTITTTLSTNYVLTATASTNSVLCNGAATGSATVQIGGGTGNYTYTWSGSAQTGSAVTGLTGGTYTVNVADLSGIPQCTLSQTVSIAQPPAFSLSISATSTSNCVGNSIILNASGSGGVPAYTYTWASGPVNSSYTVAESNSGNYVYTVNALDANSCSASATISLYFSDGPLLSVSDATICSGYVTNLNVSGANSYTWYPGGFVGSTFTVNPNTTASYTVIGFLSGCTNTGQAVSNVSVVAPPSLSISLSSPSLCAQALNGSPNSITLTSGGANSYTLVTPLFISNSAPNGSMTPISTQPPFGNGVSTATLYGSNGVCTESVTAAFNVIPNPTVSVSSNTPVICAGESFTYTSHGAASYTWGPNSPNLTTYSVGDIAVVNPSINSVFSVIGGSLGCLSAAKVLTLTVYPLPEVSVTPSTPTLCLNTPVKLEAEGTGTNFLWSPSTGLSSITGATVLANPLASQQYTLLASANNCTSSAVLTVSVLSLPTATAGIVKSNVCVNEKVTLYGSGGLHYSWKGPSGDEYSGQTINFIASHTGFSGIYTLTVSDKNNCKNTAQTQLGVYNLPQGNLLGDKAGCIPFHSDFKFQISGNSPTAVKTLWHINNQVFDVKNFSYDFRTAGRYIITGEYIDTLTSCINSGSFTVDAYPLPLADYKLSPEKPVENLDEVFFTDLSKGDSLSQWNWFFIKNKGYVSENRNTSWLFTEAGIYPVALVVTNTWGCRDTIVKAISINPDLNIYVPNAFTPNEDQLNDVFLPITRAVKDYELFIFDRWGQKIFYTKDKDTGWDGVYKGEPCKEDVYVWKINLSSVNGETKTLSGHVTLTR